MGGGGTVPFSNTYLIQKHFNCNPVFRKPVLLVGLFGISLENIAMNTFSKQMDYPPSLSDQETNERNPREKGAIEVRLLYSRQK